MGHIKIDRDTIRDLAELLEETGLTEIEVADGDKSMRVTRSSVSHAVVAPTPIAANTPTPSIVENTNSLDTHAGAVKSPMVGTAYLKPDPDSADFVNVGDTVKEGDTLMIIEAMKVMNPLKSPKSGKVTHIMVDNSQPVEFDEVLVVIE